MIEKLAPMLDAPLAGDLPSSTAGAAPAEGAIDFSALLGLATVTGGETPAEAAPAALTAAPPLTGGAASDAPSAVEIAVLPDAAATANPPAPEPTPDSLPTQAVKPLTSTEPSPLDLMARIAAWLAPKASAEQAPAEQPVDTDTGDASVPVELVASPAAPPLPAPLALPPVAVTPAPAVAVEPSPAGRSLAPTLAAMEPAPEGAGEVVRLQASPEVPAQAQPLQSGMPPSPFVLPDAAGRKAGALDVSGASADAVQAPSPDIDVPQPAILAAGAPSPVMDVAQDATVAAPVESLALEDLLVADAADGAWLDRLAGDIRMLAEGEHREAHLKLTPRMLGEMDIRLDLDGRHARVHFTVETAAAQTLIADGAGRLATLVEANGLKLDGATVDLGQGGREERQAPPEQTEPQWTQPRTPRAAPPELVRAVGRTRIAAGYERYA